jgi:glycosyltransferase involved in cell wall biosynthesis
MSEYSAADRSPRVVLSTGVGRIHFVETASALWEAGEDVRLLTGWVPSGRHDWLVNAAGAIVGRPNLARRLAVRRAGGSLPPDRLRMCAVAEGVAALGQRFFRSRGTAWPAVSRAVWKNFGRASRRHLHDLDVFHVRSGGGQGGAIAKARALNAITVADHSIAHPSFMARVLNPLFDRYGMPQLTGADDPFWNLVLQDCKDADAILVNSDFVRDTFTSEGFEPGKIHVAYLGVRRDFLALKQEYSLPKPARLLFTGGFTARKGAGDLLDAVASLNRAAARFELTVVGSLPESPALLKQHPPSQGVHFAGMVLQDELKKYLRTADMYVFPTLAEGCAKSAMEAMAAGVPVITTRECGLPARHMEHAYIVPSGDVAALQAAIETLAADEPLRRHIGTAGARLVAESFSWSDYGMAVKRFHESLLGRRADR